MKDLESRIKIEIISGEEESISRTTGDEPSFLRKSNKETHEKVEREIICKTEMRASSSFLRFKELRRVNKRGAEPLVVEIRERNEDIFLASRPGVEESNSTVLETRE